MKKVLYFGFLLTIIFFAIPPNKSQLHPQFTSFKIFDRNGVLLREVLSKDYKTSAWVHLNDISPYIIKATIFSEDKRFLFHHGVDPSALLRALYKNIKSKNIISGGSTITMQVAKILLNYKHRNIFTKLIEILYALKLELHLSKKEILEVYLNRSPYGNQTYGVEAASTFYFKKSADQVSLGEACIIAAIPKSPTMLNPYMNPQPVLKEKERLLDALLKTGVIDSLSAVCAFKESLNVVPSKINFTASHFVDYILREIEKKGIQNCFRIISSINANLQEDIEKLLSTLIKSLKNYNVNQGAVLVMETKTGEILTMVGSKNYFGPNEGQVNGCLALRQPGSSIKPFVYILALSSGIPASFILPDTIIEFRLPDGTRFAPRNYGNKYHGPTRVREALGSSFNVPTIYLLEKIGLQRFHNLLKELNFKSLNKETSFYGLSLGLGAGEVTLLDMVNAYRAIARGGIWEGERPILELEDNNTIFHNSNKCNTSPWSILNTKGVFSHEACYIITNILMDNASRIKAFGEDSPLNLPFPCAVKTGTTKDFKDNWCIGFTKKYVVGVWVGNFDGAPMAGISGISGAAPLFRDIMIELHRNNHPDEFEESASLYRVKICAQSGRIARQECSNIIEEIYIPQTEPQESCALCCHNQQKSLINIDFVHSQTSNEEERRFCIISPSNSDIYKIDPQVSYWAQGLKFKVHADTVIKEVIFKLDGKILCTKRYPFEFLWKPVPGDHKLEAIGKGKTSIEHDSVLFTVY